MLDGLHVVELGMWVAGPAAGGVLADWGARVTKIESPGGDPMRRVFALVGGGGQVESPPFDLDNRGKRSVVLDLTTDEGREVALALIGSADVFLTNLRPDAVERLGFAPAELRARFPHLVVASVTGYGLTGPDAHRPGYDVGGFWARGGVAALTAPEGEAPPQLRGGLGDHVTALAALSGILAALLERERTGQGAVVEASLLRTGAYAVGWDLGIQARWGKLAPTTPRTHERNPLVNSYRAGDGRWFWLLGVEADRHVGALCRAIERPDLLADERFADARARRKHAADFVAVLDAVFATASRDTWTERFDAHDVWWAPVNTAAEVLDDPQLAAAGGLVDVPAGPGAPAHRAVASPIRFDGRPTEPGPVPALGEHTRAVLGELGLSADRIDDLVARGVVGEFT